MQVPTYISISMSVVLWLANQQATRLQYNRTEILNTNNRGDLSNTPHSQSHVFTHTQQLIRTYRTA